MRKVIFVLLANALSFSCFSQNSFSCVIKDARSGESLENTSVTIKGTIIGIVSDSAGRAVLKKIPEGNQIVVISHVGYKETTIDLFFPLQNENKIFEIQLEPLFSQEDLAFASVIVYSFRTNARIENTPSKTEILDAEKVKEESSKRSSHIADLLGDVTGIHVQQISAVTNNKDIRIHGLPGRYTQLLRDGMPLFGGYAGSFSILQVPPLDLKQIEIIKGSNSALYGGGSIGGMINIISKKPIPDQRERYFLINQSTLRESNLHLYISERHGKAGYTFFTGASYQRQEDINNDGFSDLGRTESIFIHPTFFFYPNEKNAISLGISSNYDDRLGGDMEVLSGYYSNFHQFFIQNQTFRNTVDIIWENTISSTDKFTLKGTTSSFNRNIGTAVFGMKAKQLSYFSEASYLKKIAKHDVIAGMNLTGENLKKKLPDSTFITNYNHFAVGLFLQDDWRINSKLTIETGFRTDFHNIYKAFLLPRFAVMYKMSPKVTLRFGGGLGYRIPSIFTSDIDERDYRILMPLDSPIRAREERSQGLNLDINYHRNTNKGNITVNQSLFITNIQDPLISDTTMNGHIYFVNAPRAVITYGSETYLQLQHKALELYLGFAYTLAKKMYDQVHPYVSVSPRIKFTGMLSYQFAKRFQTTIEAVYIGKQYLDNGIQTPSYPLATAMVRYDAGRFTFVLNCENVFDYRQTKEEAILIPPVTDPRFKQLWAPIDGRVVNLSIKIRL